MPAMIQPPWGLAGTFDIGSWGWPLEQQPTPGCVKRTPVGFMQAQTPSSIPIKSGNALVGTTREKRSRLSRRLSQPLASVFPDRIAALRALFRHVHQSAMACMTIGDARKPCDLAFASLLRKQMVAERQRCDNRNRQGNRRNITSGAGQPRDARACNWLENILRRSSAERLRYDAIRWTIPGVWIASPIVAGQANLGTTPCPPHNG